MASNKSNQDQAEKMDQHAPGNSSSNRLKQ